MTAIFFRRRTLLSDDEESEDVESEGVEDSTELMDYSEEFATEETATEQAPSEAEKFAKKQWERLLAELHKLPSMLVSVSFS